jgi:hypothetical protein
MIIYPNYEENCVGILYPMQDCPLPIEAIARKDVPAGAPYLIVPDDYFSDAIIQDIPRNEWVADFSTPDGVGSNAYGNGTPFEVVGYFCDEDDMLMMRVKHQISGELSEVKA